MSVGIYKGVPGLKTPSTKEASYWVRKGGRIVKCTLCPHGCEIGEGESGKCLIRQNIDGRLIAATYGKVAAVHLDPIEKKPLYHYYPTSKILSVGSLGCNMSCKFCQNWELVEGGIMTEDLSPQELINLAEKYKPYKNIGISFTYNEPLIWFEYILDTAKLIRQRGLDIKIVLVTNGFINPKPFEEILPFIDAMNVDLKFADENDYIGLSNGHLKPVIKTITATDFLYQASHKVHIEVTYLVITDTNDTEEDFEKVTDLVANIDDEIPFHISRYFPHFQFKKPPTPLSTIRKAYKISKRKLKYVYVGNVWGDEEGGENTYCPQCSFELIRRNGYEVSIRGLEKKRCKKCGYSIKIIGFD